MSDEDEGYDEPGCKAIADTDHALLVTMPTNEDVWIPKSVIHDDSEVWRVGQHGKLVVYTWFAEKKGWL